MQYCIVGLRRVRDLNPCTGVNRLAGFRVQCITALPTLHFITSFIFAKFEKKSIKRYWLKKRALILKRKIAFTQLKMLQKENLEVIFLF